MKKEIILTGNFNINILNCDSDKDKSDIVDTIQKVPSCHEQNFRKHF